MVHNGERAQVSKRAQALPLCECISECASSLDFQARGLCAAVASVSVLVPMSNQGIHPIRLRAPTLREDKALES